MKIKNIIKIGLFGFAVFGFLSVNNSAKAAAEEVITGKGFFTHEITEPELTCGTGKDKKDDKEESQLESYGFKEEETTNLFGEKVEGEGTGTKLVGGMIGGIIEKINSDIFAENCEDVAESRSQTSIFSLIDRVSKPVNITNTGVIMKVISIAQYTALSLGVVFVVFYGLMYQAGVMGLDPMRFFVRLFLAMIMVYFLPYLMQDVLNINNMIVHNLREIPYPQSTSTDKAAQDVVKFSIVISQVIAAIMSSVVVSAGTAGLFWIGAALVFMLAVIKPFLTIIIWWFQRLIMLFALAIFGPILVMMVALPQTASLATKWVRGFIAETYSQVFMALAFYMVASIFANLATFKKEVGLDLISLIFFTYAMVLFLGEVPTLAKQLMGGGLQTPGARAMNTAALGALVGAAALVGNTADYSGKKKQEGLAEKERSGRNKEQSDTLAQLGLGGGSEENGGAGKIDDNAIEKYMSLGNMNGAEGGINGEENTDAELTNPTNENPLEIPEDGEENANEGIGTAEEAELKTGENEGKGKEGDESVLNQPEVGAILTGAAAAAAAGDSEEENKTSESEKASYSPTPATVQGMSDKASKGKMDKKEALQTLSSDIMSKHDVSPEEAWASAEKFMNGMEQSTGLGWDARNTLGKLAESGNLTSKNAEAIVAEDMSARGVSIGLDDQSVGNGKVKFNDANDRDRKKAVASFMHESGLNKVTTNTSNNQLAQSRLKESQSSGFVGGDIRMKGGMRSNTDIEKSQHQGDQIVRDFSINDSGSRVDAAKNEFISKNTPPPKEPGNEN